MHDARGRWDSFQKQSVSGAFARRRPTQGQIWRQFGRVGRLAEPTNRGSCCSETRLIGLNQHISIMIFSQPVTFALVRANSRERGRHRRRLSTFAQRKRPAAN